jgi:hypothetical protein
MEIIIGNPATSGRMLCISIVGADPDTDVEIKPGESHTATVEQGQYVEAEFGPTVEEAAASAEPVDPATVSGSHEEIRTRVDDTGAPAPSPSSLAGNTAYENAALEAAGVQGESGGFVATQSTATPGVEIGAETPVGDAQAAASQEASEPSASEEPESTDEASDTLEAGTGSDTVDASSEPAPIFGGEGSDSVVGNVVLNEGSGEFVPSTVEGGFGNDSISLSNDSITPPVGAEDTFVAAAGDDTIQAGGGDSVITDPAPEVHPDTAAAAVDSPIPVQTEVLNSGEPRAPSAEEVLAVMKALHSEPSVEKTRTGKIQLDTVNQALKAHGFKSIDAATRDKVQDENPGDE